MSALVRNYVLLLLSASACTAAGEFEPIAVSAGAAAGAASSGVPSGSGQEAAGTATRPAPMLNTGEADPPVQLLPGDVSDDNAGTVRSEEADVVRDAGLDAATDAGGEASSEPAGGSASDAGTPDAPDASPLDASTTPPTTEPPSTTPPTTEPPSTEPPGTPCPGLVFEAHCYEFFDEQLAWNDAEARCVAWGGHLASVETSEEDAFIGAWPALLGIPLLDGSGLWLGGTDALGDGDFRWWDTRPLSLVGWASDQPNNGAGVDCIEKRNDATQRWYDRRCTDGERYVCERPE